MEEIIVAIFKFLGNADWALIVPTALTFSSAIIATIYTYQISKKANNINEDANEVNKRLGELGINTQDKQRFIGTISVQRVEWINNIRNNFANFNKGVYVYGNLIKRSKIESYTLTDEENYLFPEIVYNKDMMELYLNPTEIVSKELISFSHELIKYLANTQEDNYNIMHVSDKLDEILYLQQVILKAEWKRLKKETENGKEIDEKEMENIFKEVAEAIDFEAYSLVLKEKFNRD